MPLYEGPNQAKPTNTIYCSGVHTIFFKGNDKHKIQNGSDLQTGGRNRGWERNGTWKATELVKSATQIGLTP